MTTLPAMSEDELIELWQALDPHGPGANERFARAIISARDAQWQAAVDAAVMAEREAWRLWGYSATAVSADGSAWQTSRPTQRREVAEACARDWGRFYNGKTLRAEVQELYIRARAKEKT